MHSICRMFLLASEKIHLKLASTLTSIVNRMCFSLKLLVPGKTCVFEPVTDGCADKHLLYASQVKAGGAIIDYTVGILLIISTQQSCKTAGDKYHKP